MKSRLLGNDCTAKVNTHSHSQVVMVLQQQEIKILSSFSSFFSTFDLRGKKKRHFSSFFIRLKEKKCEAD
jgi:hypothetical protein